MGEAKNRFSLFLFLGNVIMTQRYNRLVTLTAFGARAEFRLTRFQLGEYQADSNLNYATFGEYFFHDGDGDALVLTTSDVLIRENLYIFMDIQLSLRQTFVDMVELLRARPEAKMLILGPTDGQYIEYEIEGFRYGAGSPPRITLTIALGSGNRVGDAFDLTGDNVLGISGLGGQQLLDKTTRRVWAQLAERGADSGILVGIGGVQDEGQGESLDLSIPYSKDLLFGVSVTDDLGREWTIVSSATSQDRRELQFEGRRLVVTNIELPRVLEGP